MRIWLALTLGTAAILSGRVDADEPAVAAMYGSGVHAYYAESYQQSFDFLSRVIRIGTADPRAYYFRGLATLKMGRRDEAVADFTKGAELEADGWSMRTVSRSLERVQGPDRLLLERSRSGARLAVAQQQATAATSLTRSPSMDFGRRYSGIGGPATSRTPKPAAAATPPSLSGLKPMSQVEKDDEPQQKPDTFPQVELEGTPAVPSPSSRPVSDDPFMDDPFTDQPAPSKTPESGETEVPASPPPDDDPFNFAPNRRATSNTQRDQIEEQAELRDAEASDVRDQQEAMAERDAAAGDR